MLKYEGTGSHVHCLIKHSASSHTIELSLSFYKRSLPPKSLSVAELTVNALTSTSQP